MGNVKSVTPIWRLCMALVVVVLASLFSGAVKAEPHYSPSDVFAGVEYANKMVDRLLLAQNITDIELPHSHETAVKPMHVYELHSAVLAELYQYALKNDRNPPPMVTSTPISYTPTDVYALTRLIMVNIESIYRDAGVVLDFALFEYNDKTPSHVYQILSELYYKVNRLNGNQKVTPNEVYSHVYRAKEDLQYSLILLSKRMSDDQEDEKRLLITAIYGMHPDGSIMPPAPEGKRPGDVIKKLFNVREKLNEMRKRNGLASVDLPILNNFDSVKPIDVFLQAQFVIAELNMLKIPMNMYSTTDSAKPTSGKTPSDVYHEVAHIEYMLERILEAQ